MSRTLGAKNLPKNPDKELARVKELFASRGIDWPWGQGTPGQESPGADDTTFTLGDIPTSNEAPGDEGYTCGNCKMDLPSELPVCPACGASLRWT